MREETGEAIQDVLSLVTAMLVFEREDDYNQGYWARLRGAGLEGELSAAYIEGWADAALKLWGDRTGLSLDCRVEPTPARPNLKRRNGCFLWQKAPREIRG